MVYPDLPVAMTNTKQFLYGDSTPSALVTDFIALLNKGLDCFVAILQAELRMAQGAARRRELELAAGQEVVRLHELEGAVARALAAVTAGVSPDASIGRCSDVISRAATTAVGAIEAEVQGNLTGQIARIDESAAKERQRCAKALEQLLLEHDLPGSEVELRLEHEPTGGHVARLRTTAPYGLATLLELEVPATSWFARPLRVGEVAPGLEIQVPKTAGWIRKESRLANEKLGRLIIAGCAFGPKARRVSARAENADEGYDFVCAGGPEGGTVQALRVSPATPPEEFDLAEEDARAIAGFVETLAGSARELAQVRKRLIEGKLDGEPLENVREPALLVQRLVEVMAPTVREIAARSGPGELVLRRELGDGRREERFVRRADLLAKLAPLPASQRALFQPLDLGEIPGPPAERVEEVSDGAVLEIASSAPSAPTVRPNGPPQPPRTPG
jgi:hypothetical protein